MSVSKDCPSSLATSTQDQGQKAVSESHARVLSRFSHMTTRGQATAADALGDPGRRPAPHPAW